MNRYKYLLFLLVFIFLLPSPMSAQRRKKKRERNPNITSCLQIYGGTGYSLLMHDVLNSSTPGGGSAMLGVGYMMKHKSGFNFGIAVEPLFFNSSTKMDALNYDAIYLYSDDNLQNYKMQYLIDFNKYKEQHNRLSLNIPVMFGAQFNRYYFLVGAKVGLGLFGNYVVNSELTTTAIDYQLIDPLTNMPSHSLTTSKVKHGGSISYGLDIVASAEFGISIDEWMPSDIMSIGRGRKKMPLSYRVGLFADYGVLNINNNPTKDIILNFPGMTANNDGSYTVPGKSIPLVQPRSILASDRAKGSSFNPLLIGGKFTVLFQVSPKVKPKKKRPRPRPKPKQIKYQEEPPFFYCVVTDFDTDKFLSASVSLFNLDEKHDTAFAATTDSETGFIENQMKSNMFGIKIVKDGYIDYVDTLYQIDSDTLYVDLQPIKKNTIVILQNLLFDTDKTTIRNISTPSLEELYQLLTANPSMKIEITGHTDNVGSRSYNRKLSEGRAKAVYDEMVRRGIDAQRMKWKGKGSSEPIESNDTKEGRAENRRVEFRIL